MCENIVKIKLSEKKKLPTRKAYTVKFKFFIQSYINYPDIVISILNLMLILNITIV